LMSPQKLQLEKVQRKHQRANDSTSDDLSAEIYQRMQQKE